MAETKAETLLRRHKQLKDRRTSLEQPWRECYDYTYPLRGAALSTQNSQVTASDEATLQAYAKNKNAQIYDDTATDCVRILASALVAGTTPANSRWPGYAAEGFDDDEVPDDVLEWLDTSSDLVWRNIHNADFDQVAYECMVDESIAGWFAMYADESKEGGYEFEQWPLASLWAAQSRSGGPLDVIYREWWPTAEQAVEYYGETMVSDQVLKKWRKNPDEKIGYLWTIYPRPDGNGELAQNMPYASCHVELATKKLVKESGYHELPVILPRWMNVPGSVYPVGPVWDALPSIKSLNQAAYDSMVNREMATVGMWGAVDDGVLNPRTVRVGPRKVIVMNDKDSFFPLAPAGDFNLSDKEIDRLQRAVRKLLMADHLTPSDKPQMTATEVHVNVELIRQLLGPVYGRMQSEYLKPLLDRCFGLAYRAGVLGTAPEWLQGKTVSIRYNSPLARAQKLVDVNAMDRFETTIGQEAAIAGPQILDNYDWDGAARKRAELLGVPQKLIPDERVVKQKRKARDEALEQQQAIQAAAAVAEGVGKGVPA